MNKSLVTIMALCAVASTESFGQTPGTLKWRLPLNGDCWATPVIGPDGTIYVLQDSGGPNLWAVNPNGSVKWQTNVNAGSCLSLALGLDGALFFGSDAGVCAVSSANGTSNWVFQSQVGAGWVGSPAIGADGTIYACNAYDLKVYAITNDAVKWCYPSNYTGTPFDQSSPAVGADGTVYVCSGDGQLFALNPDGTFRWTAASPGGGTGMPPSPAIAADGTVYLGADGYFSAVGTDGTVKWSYGPVNAEFDVGPEMGPDGTIYVEAFPSSIGSPCTLYAFSTNGSVKWTLPLAPDSGSYANYPWYKGSSCAVTADGRICVGDLDGKLYSFNPNGTTNWTYSSGEVGLKSPVIGLDGTIYVTSFEAHDSFGVTNYLYAIYGSAPLACSPWPEFRKNSRHTASVVPATLSSAVFADKSFQFIVSGLTNMPCAVCASADLVTWTNIGSIALTGGATNYVDSYATNFQSRFYRGFPQ